MSAAIQSQDGVDLEPSAMCPQEHAWLG